MVEKTALVCFGMKGGMGVPPMIAFSHGQDARAWGLAISQKPLSRNMLFGIVLLNPGFATVCRAIKSPSRRSAIPGETAEMANPQTRARCPCLGIHPEADKSGKNTAPPVIHRGRTIENLFRHDVFVTTSVGAAALTLFSSGNDIDRAFATETDHAVL